ncbi:MAG: CRISPR-associated endonuclease Cas2 [Anaerolinea sp.]|nr:CRISPR-associated endonuclease Cas2 [Anaerolinea sp.]
MDLLVAYDVQTTDRAGQRRLRKVAQACHAYGQRVQNSVFECEVNDTQYEQLVHRLQRIIDENEDSLRIYRLREPKESHVDVYGRRLTHDLGALLVI